MKSVGASSSPCQAQSPDLGNHGDVATEAMRAPGDVLVHLRCARDHADRWYDRPLTLDDLAAVACLSKYHFLRLFRATYGVTPMEYVSQRRIERAQDLLRAPT